MSGEFMIASWSGVHKATQNYCCQICKGIIPKGVVYRSFVVSNDRRDPKRNAYRIQHHLDCDAPWYQPVDVNRLHHVGHLPRRQPPPEQANLSLLDLPPLTLTYRSKTAGELTWRLTRDISERILQTPNLLVRSAAMYELEMAMATMAEATITSASSIKKSRRLGYLLYDVQLTVEHQPVVYDWGVERDEDDDD